MNTNTKKRSNPAMRPYIIGFCLSICLTLLAFIIVMSGAYAKTFTVVVIVTLAVMQLFVQLLFFLHLGSERAPRWRLVGLLFGVLVVVILVFGSLWIMDHLNYNMMHDSKAMQQYMEKQGGF